MALRTRVNISAMGSLVTELDILICFQLPASLDDARDLAIEGEQPEAEAANAELAQKPARAPASPATIPVAALQFRRLRLLCDGQLDIFGDFCVCCHDSLNYAPCCRKG